MTLPAVNSRAAWNAARAKVQRTAPQRYTHLEVHHTASPSMASIGNTPMAQVMRNIQRIHMANNGWNDIFYNGFVGPDGVVWEGRPDTPGPYRLCFLGNFQHEKPTAAQRETLQAWMGSFDAPTDWHAKRAAGTKYASLCPGRHMIALIAELEDQADRNDRPILIEDTGEEEMCKLEKFITVAYAGQREYDPWTTGKDIAGASHWYRAASEEHPERAAWTWADCLASTNLGTMVHILMNEAK